MVEWKKDELAKLVSKNAAIWMDRRGLNQKELAIKMNNTEGYISQILNGKKITLLVIARLSTALEVDPARLLDK